MRNVIIMCALLLGSAAQAQDIVVPGDDDGLVQGPPVVGGTELIMKPYTVRDQNQLRGRFGAAWTADEVKEKAAITCQQNGMRLIYFKPEGADAKGRTEFAAVCQ
ncbi:hypothetical protein [Tropicibacter naphthalenivorans]|uniref:Uncharacterized protein n=1 Tax=Tropicibacter naphthalenivorans TaxID=441103 RepID=A0A0P1GF86_9RHOB|nr:hypothetical protein [Tropicibacter naphthalenivorans]CUH75135.1 hypothetical protein TRN7648_00279 [Tropicibacter naphthalenivorans]SMC46062.1 hypothetical protein SAMN04488093_101601 [Tropicibacter naphthalenivorans]